VGQLLALAADAQRHSLIEWPTGYDDTDRDASDQPNRIAGRRGRLGKLQLAFMSKKPSDPVGAIFFPKISALTSTPETSTSTRLRSLDF
jgi:hypothetical protein